jgi:cysteine desulfurase
MDDIIYMDHCSSTPTDSRVIEAMNPYFDKLYGNPSSAYSFAQESAKAIEEAREKVANILNAKQIEIIFTSGGTEANNLAIKGVAFANREKGNHIITSKIEHHAVLNTCKWLEKQGFNVSYIDVDKYGIVNLDELKREITDETILISVMYANNEVGTIEPVSEIAEIASDKEIYIHTDAVQAVGKIKVDVNKLGIDLLSLSAHKFYGPKGVGALFVKNGTKIDPLLHGGHHEHNKRAGTENVAGIVGLGKACEIALIEMEEDNKRLKKLRDRLQRGITEKITDVVVNGHPDARLSGVLNICVKYVEGESILLYLDKEGIAASSGSACTSDTLEPSHVLTSMGIPPSVAHGSLRFSLGHSSNEQDIDKVLEVLPPIVKKLREMSPLWKDKKGK